MGEVEICMNAEGALRVVQRDDLRYLNATVRAKQSCNIPEMFLWGLRMCLSLLGGLVFILNVYVATSCKI